MRSIDTIILRVRAGLPVTDDEAKAASEFLDKRISAQERVPIVILIVVAGTAFVMFLLRVIGVL